MKPKIKFKSSFQQGRIIANPYKQMYFCSIQRSNVEKFFWQKVSFVGEQS